MYFYNRAWKKFSNLTHKTSVGSWIDNVSLERCLSKQKFLKFLYEFFIKLYIFCEILKVLTILCAISKNSKKNSCNLGCWFPYFLPLCSMLILSVWKKTLFLVIIYTSVHVICFRELTYANVCLNLQNHVPKSSSHSLKYYLQGSTPLLV